MREALVPFLVLGLLLLGVSPAMAAAEQAKAALPAQQDEVVQVVVPEGPEGLEISAAELGNVEGTGALTFLGGLAAFTAGLDDVKDAAANKDVFKAVTGAVEIVAGWTGMLVGVFAPSP